MATIAIGDIHGHIDALRSLLDRIVTLAGAQDTVVFLGDYIDRGPDSRACIERILEFRTTFPGRLVALLGNHESWLLKTISDFSSHSWLLGMEAFDTIASYSPSAAASICTAAESAGARLITERVPLPYHLFLDAMPPSHLEFLKSLVPFFSNQDGIFTHAGLDPGVASIESQSLDSLIWGNSGFPDLYTADHPLVYGHYNNPVLDQSLYPYPRIVGRTIGIDTIAHGVLTAILLPGEMLIQSKIMK